MPSYIEGVTFTGVVETLRWGDFLTLVTAKQLAMEYAQATDSYTIWAIDGPITYTCQLVFASASANYPFPMSDGYTAAQNNTDVATFTSTYQATANLNANTPYGPIGSTAPITGSLAGGIDTTGKLRAAGVAAASTAVVASQPSFAVGLSPNSPLPAGTNSIGGVTQSGSWSVTVSSLSGTVAVTQSTSPWIVAGAGTAGTPGTAVLTVQGIAGGTAQPVSGTVAATQSGAWTTGRTWTLASGTDSVSAVQSGAWTVAATQSGTWTVQPGNTANTTPWLTTDTADGPVTPGAVATKSQLMGGQFNTALPTLTNTQQAAVQLDSSGRQLVVVGAALPAGANVIGAVTQSGAWTVAVSGTVAVTQSTSPWVTSISTALPTGANTIGAVTQASGPWTQNLTQVGGSAIALGQATMAASLPVAIASNQSALPVSQSGAWTVAVTQSTSPWVVAGGGTAGTPGTAVLTVQGIAGGTAQPVSGTVAVSSVSGTVAVTQSTSPWVVSGTATDNTANSVAKLPVLAAVATTAAPSYTNSNMVPLSTDLAGNLRITGSISATNPSVGTTGATAPTSATEVGGIDPSGNLRAPGITLASTAPTASQLALVVTVSPNSATINNITASEGPVTPGAVASKSTLIGAQFNTALPTLTNTQQAALQADSSGRLLVGSIASALPAGANVIGAVTQSGAWTVAVSGTVAVTQSTSPWVVSGTVTANQGTANSLANAWPHELTDGTHGPVAVKAASTAPVAADPALVVALSPNTGTLTVVDASIGVVGSAAPLDASQIGGSDGTNLQAVNVTVKGTQGARGLAVQELKDSGRTYLMLTLDNVAAITTEALVSASINKGGTVTSGTTYTVTAGKTLRIQAVFFEFQSTSGTTTCRLRLRSAATVTATSGILVALYLGGGNGVITNLTEGFPDGIEIAGGQQIGLTVTASSTTGTLTVNLICYEY